MYKIYILYENRSTFDLDSNFSNVTEALLHACKVINRKNVLVVQIWKKEAGQVSILHDLHKSSEIHEVSEVYQPLLIDVTDHKPSGRLAKRRSVDRTMAKIRSLHEELNKALYTHPTERPQIQNPNTAVEILSHFLTGLDHEEFWILNLDTRNRVAHCVKLYVGTANMSNVRVSEVFRQAIIDNSPSIILGHNHPSGDPLPSPEDVAVTRAIVQAGHLLDIDVLDHIIIGEPGKFVSMKERNLGFE